VWSFCVWSGQDRLLAGAIIAERIRSAVRMELGYTCSVVDMLHSLAFPMTCVEACLLLSLVFLFSILVWLWVLMGWQGIATNKLLAKIASAKNKPDRQTLVGCSFLWPQIQHLSFPQSYVQLASILGGICKSLLYLEVGSNCSNALFVMLWCCIQRLITLVPRKLFSSLAHAWLGLSRVCHLLSFSSTSISLDLCCLDHNHVSHDPLQCIALLQCNISQKLIGAVKQIPPRAVPGLMQMLPLRKIKLLGGKLGEVCFSTVL
jgi:hypothetical protein